MAQLSGETAAVKNEWSLAVAGQFALQLFKLALGEADGRRNMAFVIFGLFGPRVDDDDLIALKLFGHIFN